MIQLGLLLTLPQFVRADATVWLVQQTPTATDAQVVTTIQPLGLLTMTPVFFVRREHFVLPDQMWRHHVLQVFGVVQGRSPLIRTPVPSGRMDLERDIHVSRIMYTVNHGL